MRKWRSSVGCGGSNRALLAMGASIGYVDGYLLTPPHSAVLRRAEMPKFFASPLALFLMIGFWETGRGPETYERQEMDEPGGAFVLVALLE